MRNISKEELSAMTPQRARKLCAEIRKFLLEKVSKNGGHLASNLGVVEISVALARVFDMPRDKIVYDTGHQSYVHKLLTGRAEAFHSLRTFGGLSGFPKREESDCDAFGTGHSGTGLSAALGFAKAARLKGEKDWAVAVIGDGSFTGGMVYEALNNIDPDDRLIIILNDNNMSISNSVGALKGSLNKLRTEAYYQMKDSVRDAVLKLPGVGNALASGMKNLKDTVKRSVLPTNNFFEQFGLKYFGPADGNNLKTVEFLLREAKTHSGPSLLHLCTVKGKGYLPAEQNPAAFHGVAPQKTGAKSGDSFSKAFGRTLVKLAAEDETIAAITAAMTGGLGLCEFRGRFPERFFDVCIAEEHAMTFAAALSASGLKPCFAVYSSFFQRAFDQLFHDAALQKLPVVVALDRAFLAAEDGPTHHGLFDVALAQSIPGVKLHAPATYAELERVLRQGFRERESATVIRYPKGGESEVIKAHFPCEKPIEKKVFGGAENCAIISFGNLTEQAILAALALEQKGVGTAVIRFGTLKGYSPETLKELFQNSEAQICLFLEEGVKRGSFSQNLLCELAEQELLSGARKKILAIDETFIPHGSQEELLAYCGFTPENIAKEIQTLAEA